MAFEQPGGDRSRTLAPVLGALAVFAVVLVAVFAVGVRNSGDPNDTASPSLATDRALACPGAYRQDSHSGRGWVPRKPFGLNGDDALVPDQTPTHAVICAYVDGQPPTVSRAIPLTGRRVLQGSLATLERTLSAAPRITGGRVACTSIVATSTRNYLVGLSYGKGALWVSAPGFSCSYPTNGSFTTSRSLASAAADSYAAGRWTGR